MLDNDAPIHITRINAWAFRQPVQHPVSTSFGTMLDRPAVFVRVEDEHGCFGWGEVFANWPAAGAEHRVNLLIQDIAELVFKTPVSSPGQLFSALEQQTHIRAIQCGEMGPFRQVIAGLDIALWDLFARRANISVRGLLNPQHRMQVPTYASGIPVSAAGRMIERARVLGFSAFKVKVGFDLDKDIEAVRALSDSLRPGERLFADANQAWDCETSCEFVRRLDGVPLGWLEEPMPVDAPDSDWIKLGSCSTINIAGGENIAGVDAFDAAIDLGTLSVCQPDIAKWGGFSGCLEVARRVLHAGRCYCPHFLGGGIGLVASANLLAAVGGDGLLEVDCNPNLLRDGFEAVADRITEGMWQFDTAVGLGIEELPAAVMPFQTLARSAKR